MIDRVVTHTVDALAGVPQDVRASLASMPASRQAHDEAAAGIAALSTIELVQPAHDPPRAVGGSLRVAAWNAERLKHQRASRRLIETVDADVWLLTEVDIGMARSGNVHTVQASAPEGFGWALATEFVELGLGDGRETRWHVGQINAAGLHGNAILSRRPLADACRIALDDGAVWFTADLKEGQRRIGGRMAVAAEVGGVWCVSVHLESQSDPALRTEQIARLLDTLHTIAADAPVVIGGDLNTGALAPGEPVPFGRLAEIEPLFARLADAGFDIMGCNTPEPTQRQRPDGTPLPPFMRLDWLASRHLRAADPRTVPAVDDKGAAISDHDVIVATFASV